VEVEVEVAEVAEVEVKAALLKVLIIFYLNLTGCEHLLHCPEREYLMPDLGLKNLCFFQYDY
jgi:hypothetical protein